MGMKDEEGELPNGFRKLGEKGSLLSHGANNNWEKLMRKSRFVQMAGKEDAGQAAKKGLVRKMGILNKKNQKFPGREKRGKSKKRCYPTRSIIQNEEGSG